MANNKSDMILGKLEAIEMWARQGLSEKQIARNLDIAYTTFRSYKKSNLALFECLCRGKEVADQAVENALYQRALGYNAKETKAQKVKFKYYDEQDRLCEKEELQTIEVETHIPADVTAQKFWLINRNKDRWKDNPHKVENDKETLKLKKKEVELKEF